jgi:hypothetical protein
MEASAITHKYLVKQRNKSTLDSMASGSQGSVPIKRISEEGLGTDPMGLGFGLGLGTTGECDIGDGDSFSGDGDAFFFSLSLAFLFLFAEGDFSSSEFSCGSCVDSLSFLSFEKSMLLTAFISSLLRFSNASACSK